MWWPMTLTYIFKVIRPWLRKSCLLFSVYSSGWILLCLAQMITIIRGCVVCYAFFRIWKFEFLAIFWNFSALTLKKKPTVLDGLFPYLTQMITSMIECVAYNDLWPRPLSSRSFGLDLENRVRSVASTVPDGVFPYLYKWSLAREHGEGVSHVVTFDLDLYLQSHSTLFWLGIQHDSIVWVIMRRRGGYPQNAGVLVFPVIDSRISNDFALHKVVSLNFMSISF